MHDNALVGSIYCGVAAVTTIATEAALGVPDIPCIILAAVTAVTGGNSHITVNRKSTSRHDHIYAAAGTAAAAAVVPCRSTAAAAMAAFDIDGIVLAGIHCPAEVSARCSTGGSCCIRPARSASSAATSRSTARIVETVVISANATPAAAASTSIGITAVAAIISAVGRGCPVNPPGSTSTAARTRPSVTTCSRYPMSSPRTPLAAYGVISCTASAAAASENDEVGGEGLTRRK